MSNVYVVLDTDKFHLGLSIINLTPSHWFLYVLVDQNLPRQLILNDKASSVGTYVES